MPHGKISGRGVAFAALTTTTAHGVATADKVDANKRQCNALYVTVETHPIRFRIDGSAATASTGHLLAAGEDRLFLGADIVEKFSAIDTAAGGAAVQYTTMIVPG